MENMFKHKGKVVHLSHIDLDGIACSAISEMVLVEKGGLDIAFRHTDYHELDRVLEEIDADDNVEAVLITDLNLNKEQAEYVNRRFKKKALIDHHGTGAKVAAKYGWYFLEEGNAATKLFYEKLVHLFPQIEEDAGLRFFVEIVDAYDLWKMDRRDLWNAGAVMTNYVTSKLPVLEREVDAYLKRIMLQHVIRKMTKSVDINDAGSIINIMEKGLKLAMARMVPESVGEINALDAKTFIAKQQGALFEKYATVVSTRFGNVYVFEDVDASIVKYGILTFFEREPEAIVAAYNSNTGAASFRSANGKAREVALALGGGGHPNAAGSWVGESVDEFIDRLMYGS